MFAFNRRALRAYRKAGFRQEGVLRDAVLDGGRYADNILMAMLEQDWQAMQGRPQRSTAKYDKTRPGKADLLSPAGFYLKLASCRKKYRCLPQPVCVVAGRALPQRGAALGRLHPETAETGAAAGFGAQGADSPLLPGQSAETPGRGGVLHRFWTVLGLPRPAAKSAPAGRYTRGYGARKAAGAGAKGPAPSRRAAIRGAF